MCPKMLGIDSDYTPDTRATMEYRNKNTYKIILPKFKRYTKELRQGKDATRNEIANIAKDPEVKFITGSAHGFYNNFQGNDLEEVIWRKQCPLRGGPQYAKEEVENKIIHLTSCKSARDLGPDMVKKGCLAFFGYIEDFATPEICLYIDSQIDIALAEGDDAETAFEKALIAYYEAKSKLDAEGRIPFEAELDNNFENLRCPHHGSQWGVKTAKIDFSDY